MSTGKSQCAVCSGQGLIAEEWASRALALPEHRKVYRCNGCGHRALLPYLDQEEIDELYKREYFSESYVVTTSKSRGAKFARSLKLLKALHKQGKTFLDVGAGDGNAVRKATELGLRADGIEFSDFARTRAWENYQIKLISERLDQLTTETLYDFIHLNHVFEHFTDPVHELRQIHRLLNDDGLLYIEVPYQFNLVDRVLYPFGKKKKKFDLHSIHHPHFYTPKTLSLILEDNGFEIVSTVLFDFSRYPSAQGGRFLKAISWWLLAKLGVGTYIEVVARRAC